METIQPEMNLVSAIILFGMLQGGMLLYFFLTKTAKKGNIFLVLLLLSLVLLETEAFLNRSGYMIYTLNLLNTSIPLLFLIGPLGYFYTKASLGEKPSFKKQLPHYLPFVLYLAYSFFFFVQPFALKYDAYISGFQPGHKLLPVHQVISIDPLHIQGFVVVEGIVLHLIAYALLAFGYLYRHSPATKNQLQWLSLINGVSLLGGIVLLLSEGGVINGFVLFKPPLPFNTSSLLPSVFVYVLTFFLIKNAIIPRNRGDKYEKSALSDQLQTTYAQRIQRVLQEEKPFLNPEFSLGDLAQSAGLKPHYISQVVNSQLNMSFYDLVNFYRISEAKKILQTSDEDIKIEYLAYQVGYKSKSAFFTAFKKLTATTPAQYRKHFHFAE